MRIINCQQGTQEWFQARAGVITASRFADAISTVGGLDEKQAKYVNAVRAGTPEKEALALAGYKARPSAEVVQRALDGEETERPSDTSERYALELAVERISGQPYGDTFQTYSMKRGQEEEAFARAAYEVRFGVMVEEQGIALTDDGIFGYSTDGCVPPRAGIEVKVPTDLRKTWSIINGGPIDEYWAQIQGGLWLTGWTHIDLLIGFPDLACLKNGNDLYVRRVQRDENFIADMEVRLLKFAARVATIEAQLRRPFQPDLKLAA